MPVPQKKKKMKTRKRSSKTNKTSTEQKSPKKTDKRNGLFNITNTEAPENENLELAVPNSSTSAKKHKACTNTEDGMHEDTVVNNTVAKQNTNTPTKVSKSEPTATTSKREHTSPSNANGLDCKRAKLGGSDNDLDRELAMFGMIKNVLGKHFYDVVDRLQLDFVPLCIPNIEYCAKNHTKNGVSQKY